MKLVLPIVLAAFLAFVLGWLASKSFHRSLATTERAVETAPAHARTAKEAVSNNERSAAPPEPAPLDSSPAETRTSEGLISEALRKYALEGIDAGWHETRTDALPEPLLTQGFAEFQAVVLTRPREIGRRLAQRRGHEEKLASDDPFALLEAITEGSLGPQVAIVNDRERFSRLFACTGGPSINGLSLLPGTESSELPEGATVTYPAGLHDIEMLARKLQHKSPRCLSIRGAGMDNTLLQFRSILVVDKLDRFELRDCTVMSSCDAIDLRAAGVWRAERVRFIGFDCGAGGCGVFDVGRGGVLELESCRIEGGFGRNPGDGCLFDARSSAMLARIDHCTFDGLRLSSNQWGYGMTVVFDHCRMENMLDAALPIDHEEDGLVLIATTIGLRPEDAGRLAKRDLAELFPAWVTPTKR